MKTMIVLVLVLLLVLALGNGKFWTNEQEEIHSTFETTSTTSFWSNSRFTKTLFDPSSELVFMMGPTVNTAGTLERTIFLKTDASLQNPIMKEFEIAPNRYSFAHSEDFSSLYFQHGIGDNINEISASNFAIQSSFQIPNASFVDGCRISVKGDIFLSFINPATGAANIWRLQASALTCYIFTDSIPSNLVAISSTRFFAASYDDPNNLYQLQLVDILNTTDYVWSNMVDKVTALKTHGIGFSKLSQDETEIYTLISFQERLIFNSVNVSNGLSSTSGIMVEDGLYGLEIVERNTQIVLVYQLTNGNAGFWIAFVDKTTFTVLNVFQQTGIQAYSIDYGTLYANELLYISGIQDSSSHIYYSRVKASSPENLAVLSSKPVNWATAPSGYRPVANTYSTSGPVSYSATTGIPTALVPTFITSYLNFSEGATTSFWVNDHVETVEPDIVKSLDFTWSCLPQILPSTSVLEFQLVSAGSDPVPAWVVLDDSTFTLTLDKTPDVAEATTFEFILRAEFATEREDKLFKITVAPVSSTSSECNSNQTGNCEEAEEAPAGTVLASQSALVAGIALASASSLLSATSVNGCFSLLHQFQIYILLPMVPFSFPEKVKQLIMGTDFSIISLNFFSMEASWMPAEGKKFLNIPQNNEYLGEIGLESLSSLRNNFSMLVNLLILLPLHFWLWLVNLRESSEPSWVRRFFKVLFRFFTFSVYIRMLIEGFMMSVLSIVNEINSWQVGDTEDVISLSTAVVLALLLSAFISVGAMIAYKFKHDKLDEFWKFSEYFAGQKLGVNARMNTIIFLLIRLFSVIIVICLENLWYYGKTSLFSLIHFWFLFYLYKARPYELQKDNIVEILLQANYFLLTLPLIYFKDLSLWSGYQEDLYCALLLSGPLLTLLISFYYLIRGIYLKLSPDPK